MARPGRKPAKIPRVRKDFYIRGDLAAKVDLLLLNPVRGRVRYGAWSDLVESLLSSWIADQQRAHQESEDGQRNQQDSGDAEREG